MLLSNTTCMNQIDVLLECSLESLEIDQLLVIFTLNHKCRLTLSKPHTLKRLANANNLLFSKDLTFDTFIELANRSFLGVGCLKYYTPKRCAVEVAKTGQLELLKHIMKEYLLNNNVINDQVLPDSVSVREILDDILVQASKYNRKDIIHYAASKHLLLDYQIVGFSNKLEVVNEKIVMGAAEGGHLDLIQDLCCLRPLSWIFALYRAADGGQLHVIKYIEHNKIFKDYHFKVDWNIVATIALKGGYTDMFYYAISKGANDWDLCTCHCDAAEGGSLELLNYIDANISPIDWHVVALGAVRGKHMDLYDLARTKSKENIIRRGVGTSIFWSLLSDAAAKTNNLDLLVNIISREEFNVKNISSLCHASSEYLDIVNIIIENLPSDYADWHKWYVYAEQEYGNYEVMDLIAKNYTRV